MKQPQHTCSLCGAPADKNAYIAAEPKPREYVPVCTPCWRCGYEQGVLEPLRKGNAAIQHRAKMQRQAEEAAQQQTFFIPHKIKE